MEPGPKEEALERFEFCIQALILIAKAKYLDVMRAPNIRDALKKLLSENISVAVCSEATGGSFGCRDEDVFRRENLYIEAVDTVFTRHEAQLRALFEFGANGGRITACHAGQVSRKKVGIPVGSLRPDQVGDAVDLGEEAVDGGYTSLRHARNGTASIGSTVNQRVSVLS